MLPGSGTIKMIDIWLIHGLINPFMVFCALIASKLMDQVRKQSNIMQDTDSNPSLDSSFISVSSAAKRGW